MPTVRFRARHRRVTMTARARPWSPARYRTRIARRAAPLCSRIAASSSRTSGGAGAHRPTVRFQAWHIPSWHGLCERPALPSITDASCRLLLLLLSPLLSVQPRFSGGQPTRTAGQPGPPLPSARAHRHGGRLRRDVTVGPPCTGSMPGQLAPRYLAVEVDPDVLWELWRAAKSPNWVMPAHPADGESWH